LAEEILTPDQVRERFGQMFSMGFYTLVDEKNSIARIIEKCTARGPVEWDALNRMRAVGVVKKTYVDGNTLIMDTVLGEGELNFGPASKDLGAQALKSVKVEGEEVHTTWLGLAGASVGIGACLPQAPGVIRTIYPDLKGIGGANQVEVTVVSRKYRRLILGVDDTDSKEKGASWVLALNLLKSMPYAKPLLHKIIQLNPKVPEKTTSCVSIGASFACEEKDIEKAIDYAIDFVKSNTLSRHTSLAIFQGLRIPDAVQNYGNCAKDTIISLEQAERVAKENNIELVEITGKRGKIGALAAIGCFDMGLQAAGLKEDFPKKDHVRF
jgi:methanogenesis imperfect marker protein 11